MVPGLPDRKDGPGFLLRSTIGTAGPGLAIGVITRTFRDRAVKIQVCPNIKHTYIYWREGEACGEMDLVVIWP